MESEKRMELMQSYSFLEGKLLDARDFEGLVNLYEESISIIEWDNYTRWKTPQMAYCLARLGRKAEAIKLLDKVRTYSDFKDPQSIYRKMTLISLFIENEPENLPVQAINTIKNWLREPVSWLDVYDIVFDYRDFIRDIGSL